MTQRRLITWLVGVLVTVPTALVAHASAAQGTAFFALLVALSLATAAVVEHASAVALPVEVRSTGVGRVARATPPAPGRQCDPDAAGRPRPRAPGRAHG